MGRKVHPYGFRLGVIRDWKSRWYADGDEYAKLLHEDLEIRRFIRDAVGRAGISRVEIERFPNQVSMVIWTARPGVVIGRKGSTVKEMRRELEKMSNKRVSIDVQEIGQPDLDARLVAENVILGKLIPAGTGYRGDGLTADEPVESYEGIRLESPVTDQVEEGAEEGKETINERR